jgi:hypothetical protein
VLLALGLAPSVFQWILLEIFLWQSVHRRLQQPNPQDLELLNYNL